MTFEEIVVSIQKRKTNQGKFVSDDNAKRLAVIEIVEGFRTIREAQEGIELLKETGNHLFTAMGYEVDWNCLRKAIDMFFPSWQVKGSSKQSINELFV